MTITTHNDAETRAAFERCRRNGWRVTAMAVGKSASAWVLTVDTGAEAEAQPELLSQNALVQPVDSGLGVGPQPSIEGSRWG